MRILNKMWNFPFAKEKIIFYIIPFNLILYVLKEKEIVLLLAVVVLGLQVELKSEVQFYNDSLMNLLN